MRPLLLLPEILLFVGGLTALVGGSFLPRERQWVTRVVAAVALVASGVAASVALTAKAPPATSAPPASTATTAIAPP